MPRREHAKFGTGLFDHGVREDVDIALSGRATIGHPTRSTYGRTTERFRLEVGLLLKKSDIVGHRIANILGDWSRSNDRINYCDFIYQLDNGYCFRMPFDDNSGDLFPAAIPKTHSPVIWPCGKWWRYHRKLWWAHIKDILVPAKVDERYPDTGVIALSSRWYLIQCAAAPIGIMPFLDVVPVISEEEPMISLWATNSCA